MRETPPLFLTSGGRGELVGALSVELRDALGAFARRCGFELCRSILLGVRESRLHRPDLALRYGTYLITNYAKSLSHEVWAAYEMLAWLLPGEHTSL